MPTDGIVWDTALEIDEGARAPMSTRCSALYDWIVDNTWREPKVRGCGVGDIKAMLETGNFGGKCGDINGLFVGLSRAAGVPARDLYGIRLVPSAFGYRELGGKPAKLGRAALPRRGLPEGLRLGRDGPGRRRQGDAPGVARVDQGPGHPLVAPVKRALFGGWEGNWLAFNSAHDVALPNAQGPKLGFLMYPQAENANGRYDALDPDALQVHDHGTRDHGLRSARSPSGVEGGSVRGSLFA